MWYFAGAACLYSCGGQVVVHPRHCPGQAQWAIDRADYRPNFTVSRSVSSLWGTTATTYLSEILDQNGMDCEELQQVRVAIRQTWKDILASSIPFYNRHTVTVEGISSSPSTEGEIETEEEEEEENEDEEEDQNEEL